MPPGGTEHFQGNMRRSLALAAMLLVMAVVVACGSSENNGQLAGSREDPDGSTGSPGATADAASPTSATLRAVLEDDPGSFLSSFDGQQLILEDCLYDEASGRMDCEEAGLGVIEIDPPATGLDVRCRAMLLEGELVGVTCGSNNPFFVNVYELVP